MHAPIVPSLLFVTLALVAAPEARAGVIHVDASAAGLGTGASWANAYPSLQDALAAAGPGDQLWVAAGSYRPDDGAAQSPGDRHATFLLGEGLELYGGFDGSETLLSERAGLFDATILDGDLLGDDDDAFGQTADNSHHVVTCDAAGAVRLDGFSVMGGEGALEPSGGGGLLVLAGDVHVVDCRFERNAGSVFGGVGGGGASIEGGIVTFERCTFLENRSSTACGVAQGGGLHTAAPTFLLACRFEGNEAGCPGTTAAFGAGAVSTATLVAIDCLFDANIAAASGPDGSGAFGGGLDARAGATLLGCRFTGNVASASTSGGGGARLADGPMTVVSSVFSGNRVLANAGGQGGGLCLDAPAPGDAAVTASTFAHNDVTSAGFLSIATGGGLAVSDGLAAVSSSVFHGNLAARAFGSPSLEEQQLAAMTGGVLSLDHSLVEGLSGGLGGVGNIDGDPLFVDVLGPDGTIGTPDDDVRLASGSPCVDAGDHTALPADTFDLDGDGDVVEESPWDIDGRLRRHDVPAAPDVGIGPAPVMDMGAHETESPLPVWVNLGNALAGAGGAPLLVGLGPLTPDSLVTLALTGAAPSSSAFLILGFSALELSFKGGVLVPFPDVVLGALPLDVAGALTVEFRWPFGVPSGFELYAQHWIVDGGGPEGLAASNGVRGTVP